MDARALFSIIRPQNCLIGGLTVISGISIAFYVSPVGVYADYYLTLLIAYLTYFFVAAGGNVVNDIFDIEVDRINRPHRVLPSGRMTVRQAWAYVVVLGILGIVLALLNGVLGALLVITFILVGYAYAAKVKTLGIAGNFMVAFSFAFGVIYGSFIYGEQTGVLSIPLPTWLFFVTAFMILQARETIKGAEDVEGDTLRDVRTIARVHGHRVAAAVAALFNVIGVVCYALVWFLGFASWDLWLLMVVGSVVVIGAAVSPMTGPADKKRLLIGSTLDKVGALVGLIAFVVIPLYGIFFAP
ncbi:MAG: geranylgeranylglycerol-phosphate geranylgeranyltransferase [Candidatus Thorarchaeota archaeon]|nr:geranylgeranylglycerol-phosphate geranylgeranyltransferase [Candidatus Thorarchaeota archaeon]